MANEPFESNWRIVIWRLRRGYYSTDVVSTGKLIWQSTVNSPNRKIKTTAKFPRYTVIIMKNCSLETDECSSWRLLMPLGMFVFPLVIEEVISLLCIVYIYNEQIKFHTLIKSVIEEKLNGNRSVYNYGG